MGQATATTREPRPAPITPGSQRHPTLRYDPGLDGLRGIAVLAVLLYHAGIPWARGGFLGVDLFFVLSGYLITTLLLLEHRRWGSVDMAAFWGRRARRLLPALFATLVFVAGYAAFAALPEQRGDIAAQGVATEFYVGNWWQILNDQSYFAQFVDPSPLQHTWSLAIEEQFYLVFPALLVGVLLLRGTRRGLPTILAAGAVASAAWMAYLYQPGTDPSRVYFGTDTRIQELLVGAVLAAAVQVGADRGITLDRVLPARLRRVLGPLALVGVLLLMALTPEDAEWLYRGGFLAFCALAAVLLACVVARDHDPLRRTVGWRPLVLVGVISYGLYLWHWPLYVLLDERRTGLDGWALVALRLGVSLAVAVVSYRLIERPVRFGTVRRRLGGRGEAYAFGVAGGSALLALVVVGATAPPGLAADGSGGPGATGFGVRAFFVGDSVPSNLRENFDPLAAPGVAVDGAGKLGCGLIPIPLLVEGEVRPIGDGCADWEDQWPGEVAAAAPQIGVLWPGIAQQFDVEVDGRRIEFGTPAFEDYLTGYLDRYLAILQASSERVALVTIPCHAVYEDGRNPMPTIVNDRARIGWVNDLLRRYVAAHPEVALIDLDGWLCAPGADPEYRDGVKMRFDGLHFTEKGAALVWAWLGPQLLAVAEGDGGAVDVSASPSPSLG